MRGRSGAAELGQQLTVNIPIIVYFIRYLSRILRHDGAAASAVISVVSALQTASRRSEGASLLLDVLRGREEECALRYVVRCFLAVDREDIGLDSGLRTHEAFKKAKQSLALSVHG